MKKYIHIVIAAVFVSIMMLLSTGCSTEFSDKSIQNAENSKQRNDDEKSSGDSTRKPSDNDANGILKIHFLDVGQADSILVENSGNFMLIDAGNNADSNLVVKYLKDNGVNKLDTLVLTHSHEDHIGGADTVINTFDINKIYMPKGNSTTTNTFRSVISAIKKKGLKFTEPVVGASLKVGEASATFLAPNGKNYEDVNDYSIVIRLVYGENSFLLTGDAEKQSEQEMLAKGMELKSDVLKIGHHGSYSSSSADFLDRVNPQYAVLSVGGDDNDYGHPHKSSMLRFKQRGIPIYRTDKSGTIVLTSDGKSITFNKEAGGYQYRKNK